MLIHACNNMSSAFYRGSIDLPVGVARSMSLVIYMLIPLPFNFMLDFEFVIVNDPRSYQFDFNESILEC